MNNFRTVTSVIVLKSVYYTNKLDLLRNLLSSINQCLDISFANNKITNFVQHAQILSMKSFYRRLLEINNENFIYVLMQFVYICWRIEIDVFKMISLCFGFKYMCISFVFYIHEIDNYLFQKKLLLHYSIQSYCLKHEIIILYCFIQPQIFGINVLLKMIYLFELITDKNATRIRRRCSARSHDTPMDREHTCVVFLLF